MIRNRTGFRLHAPRQWQMSRTLVDGKGIYKVSDVWRLTLAARAHYDPVQRLGYPSRLWIDPREAIIAGKVKRVDLKLGLQQVVWGQADGLRVLDVINPLDYREFILEDFLDSRRPLWMARADVPVGQGALQLLWIPYFAPGRQPVSGNEFGAGPSFGLGLLNQALPPPLTGQPVPLVVAPTQRPAYQLKNSQFGAQWRQNVKAWDVTANYFYGWEDLPTQYLTGIAITAPDKLPTLSFQPRYERREVIGGTAANHFGPVVVRFEGGWNRRRPIAVRDSVAGVGGIARHEQFSAVVGIDYSPREWVWLSGQYFLTRTVAEPKTLVFPRTGHLLSAFVRTNFFRDHLRPECFLLFGLSERQLLARPRLTRQLTDAWSVAVGADFFAGNPRNIFGFYRSNDRALLELKWQR